MLKSVSDRLSGGPEVHFWISDIESWMDVARSGASLTIERTTMPSTTTTEMPMMMIARIIATTLWSFARC